VGATSYLSSHVPMVISHFFPTWAINCWYSYEGQWPYPGRIHKGARSGPRQSPRPHSTSSSLQLYEPDADEMMLRALPPCRAMQEPEIPPETWPLSEMSVRTKLIKCTKRQWELRFEKHSRSVTRSDITRVWHATKRCLDSRRFWQAVQLFAE
jgi:hypothetical protein